MIETTLFPTGDGMSRVNCAAAGSAQESLYKDCTGWRSYADGGGVVF